ncbi:MAG: gliding motility protein GldL [Prevotella sp.]|nr:gliding motility protein GldL [Prevotella sp.]MDY5667140.1 gliding motility protein GldL [Alloprevotella sp.]
MSKINIVVRLQHWMDSVPGQTFLNYAYSWGASIVILGALFKLTHLPGGNFMLFIGMGTEVVVFFLSAFDRPFDKDEIGKELPRDYETDDEIAAKLGIDTDDDDDAESQATVTQQPYTTTVAQQPVATSSAVVQPTSAPQFVNTAATTEQTPQAPQAAPATESAAQATTTNSVQYSTTAAEAAQAAIDAATPAGAAPFDAEAKRLAEIIRLANDELLHRAQAALSPEMEEATQEYIDKLRTLAETFKKVDEQSARLAHDSEEMSNLNRTLTAINKTYDLHFQSISKQVGTIEQINDETRQLAKRIKELNAVYGRMIEALSVNIPQTSNKE